MRPGRTWSSARTGAQHHPPGGVAGRARPPVRRVHQLAAGQRAGDVIATGAGLAAYDRQRRPRTQMITRRSRRIGAAAQWSSPVAAHLRDTALRLLPASSFTRSLAPVLDWAA